MAKPLPRLLKILPHIIDTLLLVSALILCIMIKQYPLIDSWLTVKLVFVLSYIGCAIVAMKAPSKVKSFIAFALSTLSLVIVIHIAITKAAF